MKKKVSKKHPGKAVLLKKFMSVLLFSALLFFGSISVYAQETEVTASSSQEVENNGENVVRFQDNFYYWKYNAGSYEPTGLFANYINIYDTVNELICRHADGSEEVILSANGSGPIFVAGGRLYLKRSDSSLFSVKPDGSDLTEHGSFHIWAADPASGIIIGSDYQMGNGVLALSTADHQVTKITEEGDTFLDVIDGYCYYTTSTYTDTPDCTLFRISLDGKEVTKLDNITAPPEMALGINIFQISKLDDTLYYSYGSYGGTGGFFQGGGINCVNMDGSGQAVCVEFGGISAEEFLAEKADGQTFLYYISSENIIGSYIGFWDDYPYSECFKKNLNTGETALSDFKLSRPESFVCMDDGGIYMIKENSASYQQVIPEEITTTFGFTPSPQGSEDRITLLSDLNIAGDQMFFTVESSLRSAESDMGWRAGYKREKTTFYTMNVNDGKLVEIYSY